MKKKAQRSSLKYICAIAMSLFSLIALFAGTLAWFQSIRVVDQGADDFDVVNTSMMIKTIKVYNQVDEATPYTFKSTPAAAYKCVEDQIVTDSSVTTSGSITIGPYTSLAEVPDRMLLYLFEIDTNRAGSASDNFSIKIKTETTNSADAGANGTGGCLVYKDAQGNVSHKLVFDVDAETKAEMQTDVPGLDDSYFGHNSMSSIISFTAKGISSFTASNNKYDLTSAFQTSEDHSFVHDIISDTNGDITYDYTQKLDVYTREIGTVDDCPSYVAVICHYNPLALQYVFNINLGNPVADSEIVIFACDWYFEIR